MSDGARSEKGPEVRWLAIGKALDELGLAMTAYRSWAVVPTGFSVRSPRAEGDEFLITARGVDSDGAPVVTFHGAVDLGEAVRGLVARLKNGTARWRPDEWAGGR